MNATLDPIDHPSFANACARYFASLTEELTEAMRAKGYPQAVAEIWFRAETLVLLRPSGWGIGASDDTHHLSGKPINELVETARALIAAMPDVTGYAADFGAVA